MKQLTLNNKEVCELDRLYIKRKVLFDDLKQKLDLLINRKKDLINNYMKSSKIIDMQIERETYKQKHLKNQR